MVLKYFVQSKYNKNKLVGCCIRLLIFFFMGTEVVLATQTPADELTSFLDNIHTMQANFKQFTINHKGMKVGQNMEGRMLLDRPGKFRWEIMHPNKQLLIINNGKSWFYDADLSQITKGRIDYKKPGNPAMLLSGTAGTLKQLFKIIKVKKSNDDTCCFELKPRSSDLTDGYQWIKMCFSNDKLKTMRVASDFGQCIEVYFYDIVLNVKISPNGFVSIPFSGIDVLDEE